MGHTTSPERDHICLRNLQPSLLCNMPSNSLCPALLPPGSPLLLCHNSLCRINTNDTEYKLKVILQAALFEKSSERVFESVCSSFFS
jgi:hypothetical protein